MTSELSEKVKASIERLKAFCPPEGYYLAFSGGKDSVVVKRLLDMSGCKYDATYRITSVDPPELYRFIRDQHPDVKREYPRDKDGNVVTMWNLIPKKMYPPTRIARYCCEALKESGGDGRMTVTGVRWAESVNRKRNHGTVTIFGKGPSLSDFRKDENFKPNPRGGVILVNDNEESRRTIEHCYRRRKISVNPIVDWEDRDVWEFIHAEDIPYCKLYEEGYHRLGCIGCPMASRNERERGFMRWPTYKAAYLKSFDRMLTLRMERHLKDPSRPLWRTKGEAYVEATAVDVYNLWMEYDMLPGQMDILEDYDV